MSDERAPGFRGRCTQCGAAFVNHCTDPARPHFVVFRSCNCPRPMSPRQMDAHRFVALGGFDLERASAVQERIDALIAARLVQLSVARAPWDATAWGDACAGVVAARAAVLESVTFALERIGEPTPNPRRRVKGLVTEVGWYFACDCVERTFYSMPPATTSHLCKACGLLGMNPEHAPE
jgi:hypothetical protein